VEGIVEGPQLRALRAYLWQRVQGPRILELGVGTGRNLRFHPTGTDVTAIDLSTGMLRHAKTKASRLRINADLRHMDIQRLDFPDATFDTVIATLVFCSVADPVLGLSESFRVCKPAGKLLLLEHGISSSHTLAKLMNALEWLVGRIGEHVNRRPENSTQIAGFKLDAVRTMALGVIRLIEAHKPGQ